jgi:hypothetical protein
VGSSGTLAMKTTHPQTRPARRAAWVRRDAGIPDSTASARTAALSLPGVGGEACLSSEVERLLGDVVADGFALYCCGPRATPWALVASYQWEDYLDLLTIRRFDRITTARIPARSDRRVRTEGRGVGLRRTTTAGVAGITQPAPPDPSSGPHQCLPRASCPAHSPHRATPHEHPAPPTTTHRPSSRSPHRHDGGRR